MPTQLENDSTYLGVALLHAELSKAKRLKVGACLVLDTGALIPGVNGLPTQLGNECEYLAEDGQLVTKQETIHAEIAVLLRAAKTGLSTQNSTLYLSHSPCFACSSAMIAAGVKEIVFAEEYRDTDPLTMLEDCGIIVRQFNFKD